MKYKLTEDFCDKLWILSTDIALDAKFRKGLKKLDGIDSVYKNGKYSLSINFAKMFDNIFIKNNIRRYICEYFMEQDDVAQEIFEDVKKNESLTKAVYEAIGATPMLDDLGLIDKTAEILHGSGEGVI